LIVFSIAAIAAVGREFRSARGLERAYPLARVCIGIPVAIFAADHFTQVQSIAKMVPSYMPAKLFWAWFVGAALLATALSLIFRVCVRLSATLLGIMMLCFVVMMDIPGAMKLSHNRFIWALLARETVFGVGGILLGMFSLTRKRTAMENRLASALLCIVAAVTVFYGVEQVLHPQCVPAVPLQKVTPGYIPLAHFWTSLTGGLMILGGLAMLVRRTARVAAAMLGAWVVLLVMTLYLAIMLVQRDIEGINYFGDTLMFGGVLLAASGAYASPR